MADTGPIVILSEAKDLMAIQREHGPDGDEILRFAQDDRNACCYSNLR
jgi:hypothetical protein